ncbi:MAG: CHAT domain-containing protein, partial [Spirulinaceae cyanobacterium]
MDKLVTIKLNGDLHQGFRVSLEVGKQNQLPEIETCGYLPKSPELAHCLTQHWDHQYRSLGSPARLKAKRVIYDGSLNKKLEACQKSSLQLRGLFNQWLNSEQFLLLDKRIREALSRDEEIKFLVRSEDANLQKLPWHLWDLVERYPQAEVVMGSFYLERNKIATPVFNRSKLRVLAILGHSEGININADRQYLESLPNTKVVFLVEPKHQELNEQLWKHSWDLIFFAGHSESEGETGRIYLNQTESLTINELRYGLQKAVANGLQLAIFNSCDGLALAQQLNKLQIPQMIVMRELVPDRVAQDFLKHFLTAWGESKSLNCAVREARERLQGLESEFPCASWLPIVFQNPAASSVELEKKLNPPSLFKAIAQFFSRIIASLTTWSWPASIFALLLTLAFLTNNYLLQSLSLNHSLTKDNISYLAQQKPAVVDLGAEQALWELVFTQQIAQSKIVTLEQNGRFLTNHFPDYQCSNTDDVQGIISSTGEVDLLLKSSQSGTELSFQS